MARQAKVHTPLLPTFGYEGLIECGCDEAGRGCLAGPVVAAAVILPEGFSHPLLNDSKQLTERQRELLRPIIEQEALAWGVGSVSPEEIDQINILRASFLAMHRAIDDLILRPYAGPESLRQGAYDIWEPALSDASDESAKPDLIVVPGIAFDRQLNRLGRGRGYYDRLLSDLSLPCVGLAFAFQLFNAVPVDAHDRRMTAVVTDEEVVE